MKLDLCFFKDRGQATGRRDRSKKPGSCKCKCKIAFTENWSSSKWTCPINRGQPDITPVSLLGKPRARQPDLPTFHENLKLYQYILTLTSHAPA